MTFKVCIVIMQSKYQRPPSETGCGMSSTWVIANPTKSIQIGDQLKFYITGRTNTGEMVSIQK